MVVRSFHFKDVYQAIAYYRYKNPARARFKNLLEIERASTRLADEFTGENPSDIWASVCLGLQKVKSLYSYHKDKFIFDALFGPEPPVNEHDIASALLVSPSYVFRKKRDILENLTRELKFREVLVYDD